MDLQRMLDTNQLLLEQLTLLVALCYDVITAVSQLLLAASHLLSPS